MSMFGSSDKTRLRKDRIGMNPVTAGAIVLVIVVIAVYFGFTKHIPFTHGYRIKGVFTSAVSIRKNSPVRIAGVNVGKVTGISRYKNSDASVVSMELQDKALPLHRDATMKIRPRIFLEGNFFVDLRPGTPRSPSGLVSFIHRPPITTVSQQPKELATDAGARKTFS